MTTGVFQAIELQKTAELVEQEQVAGAGAEPTYVLAEAHLVNPNDLVGNDSVEMTSTSSASSPASSSAAETEKPVRAAAVPVEQEEENYVENSDRYIDLIEKLLISSDTDEADAPDAPDAPPAPPPPPPPPEDETEADGDPHPTGGDAGGVGGSGGTPHGDSGDGAIDVFGDIDEDFDDLWDSWEEDDFVDYGGGDGDYWGLNGEAAEAFTEKVMLLLNRLLNMAITMSLKGDVNDAIDEIFSGQPLEKNEKATLRGGVLKRLQSVMKTVQTGWTKILDVINKHNEALYNDKMSDIQGQSDSTLFKIENWYKSGEPAQELNRAAAQEQEKFLAAMDKNVNAFKGILNKMIEMLIEGMAGDSQEAQLLMGVVIGLGNAVEKMDGFSQQIQDTMEECNKAVDDMEYIDNCDAAWDKMWSGGWDNFWDGLGGLLRAAQDWLEEYIPGIGHLISWALEGIQWAIELTQDPVEFVLTLVENVVELIAMVLDLVGEFVDKLIWSLFGWIWDTENYGTSEGWDNTWTNGWMSDSDDGYGTHGIGDVIQWVGRVVVDDIIGNIIVDNLVDAIRFVLYEVLQRAVNWINDNVFGGHEIIITPGTDDPGKHDYFGMEIDLTGAGGSGEYSDDVSYSTGGKVLKWDKGGTYDPNKIQDLEIDKLIRYVRGAVITAQNAHRVSMGLSLLKQDIRLAVFRALTGLNGVSGNRQLLATSSEIMIGPVTQFLDAGLTALMTRAQIFNTHLLTIDSFEKLEAAKPAMVAAIATTVVALVISIICCVFGAAAPAALIITAAVMGVVSAASNMAAQRIMAKFDPFSIEDPEIPDDAPGLDEDADPSGAVEDSLLAMDQELAALEHSLAKGGGFSVLTDDGQIHLDSKAVANLERQLNAINNAIRVMFYLAKAKQDIRRIIQATLTGTSADITAEGTTMRALEAVLSQRQALISGIVFQTSQAIAAKNMATKAQTSLDKAQQSGGAQMTGAALSLVVACIPVVGGTASGVLNIVISLASSIMSIATSLANESLNMSYQSNDEDLEAFLQQRAGSSNSFEDRLDQLEAKALLNMMKNGLVSTGDGYVGVDYGLVAKTINNLKKIAQLKQVLADANSLKAKVRSVVQRSLTGVAQNNSAADMTKAVNMANFNAALRICNNLVSDLKTTADVSNAANAAEKEAITSCIAGAINVAVSVAALAGTLASAQGSAMAAFGSVAPAVCSVVSALINTIINSLSADSDMGEYEDYDAEETVDEMNGGKTNKSKNKDGGWEAQLDDVEADIMAKMNSDLLRTMGCSALGVSPETAEVFLAMDKLYNMRMAIAAAMEVMKEVKAAMGHYMPSSSLMDIIESNRSGAMATLGALKSALDSIAERQNQITQAKAQAIASAIQLAFSIAQLGISAQKVAVSHAMADEQKLGNNPGKMQEFGDELNTLGKAAASLNFLGNLCQTIVPLCFDQYYQDNPVNSKDVSNASEAGKRRAHAGKGEKGEKGEKSKGGGGFALALDQMDEEIAYYDYKLAELEQKNSAIVYLSSRNERVANYLKALPQSIVNLTDTLIVKDLKERGVAQTDDQSTAPAAAAASEQLAAMQAPAVTDPASVPETDGDAPPSTSAYIQVADALIASMQAEIDAANQDIRTANNEIQNLETGVAEPTTPPADRTRIEAEIARLKQELQTKQDKLTELIARRDTIKTELEAARTSLPAQEQLLQTERAVLRQEKSNIGRRIGEVQEALEAGTMTAAAAETELATLSTQLSDVEAKMEINGLTLLEVQQEAEGIKNQLQQVADQIQQQRQEIGQIIRELGRLQQELNTLAQGSSTEAAATVAPAAASYTAASEAAGAAYADRTAATGREEGQQSENIEEGEAERTSASSETDTVDLSPSLGDRIRETMVNYLLTNFGNISAASYANLLLRESGPGPEFNRPLTAHEAAAVLTTMAQTNPDRAAAIYAAIEQAKGPDFFSQEDRMALAQAGVVPAQASAAAAVAVQPQPAQQPQSSQTTTRTNALLEQANRLEAALVANTGRAEALDANVRQIRAELAHPENLPPARRVQLDEQLRACQAERVRLFNERVQVHRELSATRTTLRQQLGSIEQQLASATDPQERRELEAARQVLTHERDEVETKLSQMRQGRDPVRARLAELSGEISSLRGALRLMPPAHPVPQQQPASEVETVVAIGGESSNNGEGGEGEGGGDSSGGEQGQQQRQSGGRGLFDFLSRASTTVQQRAAAAAADDATIYSMITGGGSRVA